MSVINVETRHFADQHLTARHTERTGWGIFAETAFEVGATIFLLHTYDTPDSTIVKWENSFGECYDRGFTILPDFALCSVDTHPFWNMNHSCNPNAGFVRWGR